MRLLRPSKALSRHASMLNSTMRDSPPASRRNLRSPVVRPRVFVVRKGHSLLDDALEQLARGAAGGTCRAGAARHGPMWGMRVAAH